MVHSITPQKSDFPNLGQTTSSSSLERSWQPQVPNGLAMLTTTIIIGGLHWLEAQLIVRKQKMLLNMRPLSYSWTSFTHLHPTAMRRVSKRKQIHVFPKTFHLLDGQLIQLLFEKQKSSKISTFQIVLKCSEDNRRKNCSELSTWLFYKHR